MGEEAAQVCCASGRDLEHSVLGVSIASNLRLWAAFRDVPEGRLSRSLDVPILPSLKF